MLSPQLRVLHVAAPCDGALPPGSVITVHAMPFLMGRGFANHLKIDHPDVSRRHACVRLVDDYYLVEDLNSRNGTLVNNARLGAHEQRKLDNGDIIQLATAISLTFIDPFVTQARLGVRPLHAHGLWLDSKTQDVLVNGQPVLLPAQQYRLLALLYTRPGVVPREEIAQALWSVGVDLTEQMIDNTISRLRANLKQYEARHEYIVTVRGRGYQFVQLS